METSKQKFALTKRQKDALDFIKKYIAENEQSPSHDEIMEGIGLASKSGVNRLVVGLKERGWVDFLPNQARTIIIL